MFRGSETVDFPNGIINFGSLWLTILISRKIDAVLQFLLAGWMILGSKSSIWQKICPYLQVLLDLNVKNEPKQSFRILMQWSYELFLRDFKIPTYSREQKHVSDTPMLLIEIDSISNMGCQK